MRKEIKEKELQKEEVEKTKLEEAFALWRHEAKSGASYLTGNTPEAQTGLKLVGYFNSKKRNPKEPDIRVYSLDEEGNQDKEVCSMWENVSKDGNQYLTGTTDDKEKIIAFYDNLDMKSKRPYIRAYYKQD